MAVVLHELILKDECYKIIGLCMKVHSTLGAGFREVVYHDALEIEFKKNGVPYLRERTFEIKYEGFTLPHRFRADFLIFDSIILEIKSASTFHPDNFYQTLNYLKASQVRLGLLVNFGESKLKFHRVICGY